MDALESIVRENIARVSAERLRDDLFSLCQTIVPFRTANRTLPGHTRSTLDQTDVFIAERLKRLGYEPAKEEARAQAYRFDAAKPRRTAYATPLPDDPWYVLKNIYAERPGVSRPEEIVLLMAHKDSQSWYESPGAYDNGVGTVGLLEIARILARQPTARTVRFLWCNEEHRPWTSVVAADNARRRGDRIIAAVNVDSIGGKSQATIDAGEKPNVALFTTPEGERLARRMVEANERFNIGLAQRIEKRPRPGDDDGSFVKAGFAAAIATLGSYPYADPNYHDLGDTPDKVDVENVRMAVQLVLATVLWTTDRGAA